MSKCEHQGTANVNSMIGDFKADCMLLTQEDPRGGIRAVLHKMTRKGALQELQRFYWRRHRTYAFVRSKQLL
jgi:hypothetical protein